MVVEETLDIVIEDHVAWVTMKEKTVTPSFAFAVHKTIKDFEANPDIRVVVLVNSHPKIYFAGADLKGLGGDLSEENIPQIRSFVYEVSRLMDAIENFSKPTIAAVDGFALGGGCELCLACDIILASEKAEFGFPEVNLGLIASAGGTYRLARRIGKHRAMEMLLTSNRYNAEEAMALGLINKIIASENLYAEAREMARRIARNAPIAVRGTKECVVRAESMFDLQFSNQAVDKSVTTCLRSQDIIEGVIAFMQKRKPEFKGE